MDAPPTEIIDPPGRGRIYSETMLPGIADVGGDGRAHLDAIARWLQDVAYRDLVDAGFEGRGVWIVRRMRMRVERFPRFGEEVEIRTFCSGLGRFSAERRTTVEGAEALVETVSHWAYLAGEPLRPARFPEEFLGIYAVSAGERPAPIRLHHTGPPDDAQSSPWSFRASDIDLADHVNNSHYWAPLEQELRESSEEPATLDAEIEHHAPAQPGEAVVKRAPGWTWISGADGELQASIRRLD